MTSSLIKRSKMLSLFFKLTSACVDTEKEKKLVFLTRQLELLLQKQFSVNDYCFALQSYPKCNYEQLRDFLVLPCKRKLMSSLMISVELTLTVPSSVVWQMFY
ncbi:hypothetical protein FHG87_018785 [Trinorchestia longiramus]|nr:hypothetical protein FHG87_018785 [Trinorchestia longiramus]